MAEHRRVDRRPNRHRPGDTQVDVTVDERSGLLIRRHGMEFDIGLGPRRAKPAKEPWNELEGGRVDETQTETAAHQRKLLGRPGNPLRRDQKLSSVGQKSGAVGRQPHPSRGARERETEVGFELPDLLTERRLGNVKAVGGPSEVQFLGHGDEGIEVPQVRQLTHAQIISISPNFLLHPHERIGQTGAMGKNKPPAKYSAVGLLWRVSGNSRGRGSGVSRSSRAPTTW